MKAGMCCAPVTGRATALVLECSFRFYKENDERLQLQQSAWVAGHSAALDFQREIRGRHGARPIQPSVVHAESRHSERNLLPPGGYGVHPRPGTDNCRRPFLLLRGKTPCHVGG